MSLVCDSIMLLDGCLHGDQGFWCDRPQIVAHTFEYKYSLQYICTNMYVCVHIYKYVRIRARRTHVNTKGFELEEQIAQADDVGEWETK